MKTFLALTIAAVVGCTPAVAAQPQCYYHPHMIESLADNFAEGRTGIGLDSRCVVVEVYVAPETGTWTVVITGPDMNSCIVAAGTDWQALTEQAPTGEPS